MNDSEQPKKEKQDLTDIVELSKDFNQNNPEEAPADSSLSVAPPSTETQATSDDFVPFENLPPSPEQPVVEGGSYEPPQATPSEDLGSPTQPSLTLGPTLTDAPLPPPAESPLPQVQQFSERASEHVEVPASYPFTVLIEGKLASDESERLLDIISRENLGIREVDLEPQFVSGKILIPRISEFAAVMIVQALRGTQARISVGPSDEIFATADTRDTRDALKEYSQTASEAKVLAPTPSHPAETIPLTSGADLPGLGAYQASGVVTASAALKSNLVEAERSEEYQEILEALQREIRYKAYHKGAIGILHYQVQLVSLNLPSHYKVMVSGTTVKSV